jgi:hypothetical protein
MTWLRSTPFLVAFVIVVSLLLPDGWAEPPEDSTMQHQVYTLGVWTVHEGRQSDFIAAWKRLGEMFAALPNPPAGKGVLIQSTSTPTLFYSFGPWHDVQHVEAMRASPEAQAGIRELLDLCTEATPGTFRVVAESPQ